MSHVPHHSRPLSDSSLQHREVLSIAALTNEQKSSIPACAASLGVGPSTKAIEGLPTLTVPVTTAPGVENEGNGSCHPQRRECQDGMEMQVQPVYQMGVGGGRPWAQNGYMQCVVGGELGPESVGLKKSLTMSTGRK